MIQHDKILLGQFAAVLAKGQSLSSEEEQELDILLAKYPNARTLLEQIIQEGQIVAPFDIRRIDIETEWQSFSSVNDKPSHSNILAWVKPWIVAASLLLIIGGAWFWKTRTEPPAYLIEDTVYGQKNDILPGGTRAILEVGNREIELDGADKADVAENALLVNNQLIYRQNGDNILHRLRVPVRSTYKVILSDGTKVWVNADSELEYMSNFSITERRVKLKGEAFFEVAKDTKRPFIVESKDMDMQAVGTAFNVRAYQSDSRVVLTEGRLRVNGKGQELLIDAGFQVSAISNKLIKTAVPNVEEEIAWKDGYFYFNNKSLKQVMHEIERWYGISVIFERDLNNKQYDGGIKSDVTLAQVCAVLKDLTGYQFVIEGKVLIVK